jgi:hypothetical protein
MRTSKLSTLAAAVLLVGGTNLAIAAGHKGRSESATAMGRGDLKEFCRKNPWHWHCRSPFRGPATEGAARGQVKPAQMSGLSKGKKLLGSRIASSTRIIGVAAMCGRRAARQRNLHPEAKPHPHTSLAVNAGQVGLFGLARARALSALMASCKGVCAQHTCCHDPAVRGGAIRPSEGQLEWVGRI